MAALVLVLGSGLIAASLQKPPAASIATLGIVNGDLAVDGEARFLLGVSLFDALGSSPPRDEDLTTLQRWGISIIRVWAHWHAPVYAADGSLTPEGRERLTRLAQQLQQRRLGLELVLLRPGQLAGQPYAVFASPVARLHAVEALSELLKSYRGVIFDLYNEHDHDDGSISHAGLRRLRDAVKAVDPSRLVTVSSTEHHFLDGKGQLTDEGRDNLRNEVGTAPGAVAVDFLAPHFPRTADWMSATTRRLETLQQELGQVGARVPIYLNEERRARPNDPLAPEAYRLAAQNAWRGGAAGWIFHTVAGYALARQPFVAALTNDEREALSTLAAQLR